MHPPEIYVDRDEEQVLRVAGTGVRLDSLLGRFQHG